MTNPFRTPEDYEHFLYTLAQRYPSIRQTTVTLVMRGHSLARVSGEIHFENGFRLVILAKRTIDAQTFVTRRIFSAESYSTACRLCRAATISASISAWVIASMPRWADRR